MPNLKISSQRKGPPCGRAIRPGSITPDDPRTKKYKGQKKVPVHRENITAVSCPHCRLGSPTLLTGLSLYLCMSKIMNYLQCVAFDLVRFSWPVCVCAGIAKG